MPPPTASDSWLASRRFGVIIDAGSSGSRLQIYSWKDPRVSSLDRALHGSLPRVEKGTREDEDWISRVEPGISTIADDPERVAEYLAPLLTHARSHVPPSLQPETSLFLLATAGMRLLSPAQQGEILLQTCKFLKYHSNFRIEDRSLSGPCGSSVRIITGEEEGLFGWIAVNYLMDGFIGSSDARTTYGFLDMGGASTQIAFEPSEANRQNTRNLIHVRLRRFGGDEIQHDVFVTTWLGYGTNQARQRYVDHAVGEFERTHPDGQLHEPSLDTADVVNDPCLPKNLRLIESIPHLGPSTMQNSRKHVLVGTGSFEQCLQQTSTLLNKEAPCPDLPCLFNGVHVPPIDFSVSHFIGVSEYWYSSEHVFGLGGPYDFVQYERAASSFCSRDWEELIHEHDESRTHVRPGGDKEVGLTGQILKTGGQMELSRLQMQCFKAAWITNVLHEGFGLPRIVDPGGNVSADGDKVAEQASRKGLGKPAFQSLESVGDIAITWTLGKMVLEASKEIPPVSKHGQPLADPLVDIPDSPFPPIRPQFIDIEAIEDRISHHLPSLSRISLGFSPVFGLFYFIIVCAVAAFAYRIRRSLRAIYHRIIRSLIVRDNLTSQEEGKVNNGGVFTFLSPSQRWLHPFRRFLFSSRPRLPPSNNIVRPAYAFSVRNSPTPSHSFSNLQHQNGFGYSATTSTRSSSPSLSTHHPSDGDVVSRGLPSPIRSRNSSQLNLSTLIPRQANPLSRSNSMLNAPRTTSLQDE